MSCTERVGGAERALGGLDVFLPYVKHYVQRFMGQSITTRQWKDDLVAYFKEDEKASKALEEVLWDVRCFVGVCVPGGSDDGHMSAYDRNGFSARD